MWQVNTMEQTHPTGKKPDRNDAQGSASFARAVAAVVLVPAVPMLFMSVAVLALFYAAPTRFGGLLARLPGESFIRSALVFAPVTLFAVVVLAFLYVIDRPAKEATVVVKPQPVKGAGGVAWERLVGGGVLLMAVPALLLSVALWALSFISPGRFERLLEPLPGDAYLQELVPYIPFLLFAVVVVAAIMTFSSGPRPEAGQVVSGANRWKRGAPRLADLAVVALLISTIPMFLASLAGFGLYHYAPERFERLLLKLPFDEFVRLGLAFAPVVLFAVVVLAAIYLVKPTVAMQPERTTPVERRPRMASSSTRSLLAVWLLIGGLALSAVMGLGLTGAAMYLVVR
jgi:hypothetical protein